MKQELEFLKSYLEELQSGYAIVQELCPCDFTPQDTPPTTSLEAERVARLVDEHGFDGSIYRSGAYDYEPALRQHYALLIKQIDTIPRIVAAIEKPADKSVIPPNAELLTIPQVATLLNWAEGTVRERDKQGRLPMPIRFGGTIQWRREELENWLGAGCPPRQKWEQIKGGN